MASSSPFPLMPPKSTQLRLAHFDENVYTADGESMLYRFLDAMCGDAGAGNLKKEIFLQRLSGALDGIYGNTLDYIFGGVRFLARLSSESYKHDTDSASATSPVWDEVMVKDAAYRARIREFFAAATAGGTPEGIRMAVHAATSADCQVIESWRRIDNFGIDAGVGRAMITSYAALQLTTGHRRYFTGETAELAEDAAQAFVGANPGWVVEEVRSRAEVTVVPHKGSYGPREARGLRDMLDRMTPQDTVVTINPAGLAVNSPVPVRAVAADSTYYQVEKVVTGAPELDELPPPEMLAIDLDPSERWLFSRKPELAPYARFNITSEYGYYYLVSGGARSPIDSVRYGTLRADGTVEPEETFAWYEQTEQYGPWTAYEKTTNPAYATQADYVAARKAEVLAMGGEADDYRYRLPMQRPASYKRSYTPDLAIASTAPSRDSTITSSWTSRTRVSRSRELRSPASFSS
jgi:hypothetical protein